MLRSREASRCGRDGIRPSDLGGNSENEERESSTGLGASISIRGAKRLSSSSFEDLRFHFALVDSGVREDSSNLLSESEVDFLDYEANDC